MSTFIKIEKPCNEPWENMHEVSGGKFCDLCAKKVLDLTNLSEREILEILDNSNGEVCGRINKNRLDKPLFAVSEKKIEHRNIKLKYSKVAAGIVLATSLTGLNASQNPILINNQEIVSNQKINSNLNLEEKDKISDQDFEISGKLINKDSKEPLANTKITLITLEKIFTTVSDKNGNFSLKVPEFYIDKKKNVLHFEFQSGNKEEKIYKKEELIKGEFSFDEEKVIELIVVGGISRYRRIPTVFVDGDEIDYDDYIKMSRDDYKVFYFYNDIAKAIYSDATKDGLILLYSK